MIFYWQKRAYDEGYKAFRGNLKPSNCPYKHEQCLRRNAWLSGYQRAEYQHSHNHSFNGVES